MIRELTRVSFQTVQSCRDSQNDMCLLLDCRLSLTLQLLLLLLTLKLMQEELHWLALTCYRMKRDAESKRRPHTGKPSCHVL